MGPLHSAHPFALTSDPKPTIVLVPDAWFPTTAYAHFLSYLREREFPVEAINHPSLAAMLPSQATAASGSPPNSASSEIDAMSLLQHLLRPLIEREHRDVVLLMHCYGGIPGMGAARGLSKVQRWQQGLAGGIVGMIAVSPLILRTSATLQSAGIPLMQWAQRDVPRQGYCIPDNPLQMLADDCDADAAQHHLSHLRPMATRAMESPQPPSALDEYELEGCLGAIVLTEDHAMPLSVQDGLLNASGRRWLTQCMSCSHSAPFVDRCEDLAGIVEDMTNAFEHKLASLWASALEGGLA